MVPGSNIEERMRDVIRQQVLANPRFARGDRVKLTPYTPEALAARADFVERWDAFTQEGLTAGFIDWADDGDGSQLAPVTGTEYRDGREWAETEAEQEARVDEEIDHRLFDALPRMLKNLS